MIAPDAGPPIDYCPRPDPLKIAPFPIDRSTISADVPSILDPKRSLGPFNDRVLSVARGGAAITSASASTATATSRAIT